METPRVERRSAAIQTQRTADETPFEYHRRLVYGKLVDKTLADLDYTEIAELVYGKPYASDVARRMLYGSRMTLELLDAAKEDDERKNVSLDLDERMIELRKERQKLFDQRVAFNKVVRERSRQEELNDIITHAISNGNLPTLSYARKELSCGENTLLVSLNDIHYGASYKNFWGEYNSDICRKMMRGYLDNIIKIASTHGSGECIVWQNGDSISGNIHRSIQVTNKENVIEQVMGVSELIAEFIAELSGYFGSVKYVSVSGNHSRIEPKKEDAMIDERLDDLVEWYLAARLSSFENVTIGAGEKIDSTMYIINVRGKNYIGVHGDLDATALNVQSLQTMAGRPAYAILSGHKHHNKIDDVQGIKTIMAGSFLGTDDYCVKNRIYGRPQQLVCVCDDCGIVCYYDINLK